MHSLNSPADRQRSLDLKRIVKPTRILVATNLTDPSTLIPHAVAQGKRCGALVTLLHVIVPAEGISSDAVGDVYFNPERLEEDATAILKALVRQVEASGVSCDWIIEHGQAPEVIRAVVEKTGASRLILASHGRGRLGQLLLGSVARQLLGRVEVPVFVLGPMCDPSPAHAVPRRILHPVSMNGSYRSDASAAMELARFYQAELTLLHIPDRDMESTIPVGCTLAWAEDLAGRLLPDGLSEGMAGLRVRVAFGDPVHEIRDEAARLEADWIVLGVDGDLSKWPMPECAAYRVMAISNCPVLVLRQTAGDQKTEAESGSRALIGAL